MSNIKKWEYKAIRSPYGSGLVNPYNTSKESSEENIAKFFNELGEEGWELCAVDKYAHIFKREKIES